GQVLEEELDYEAQRSRRQSRGVLRWQPADQLDERHYVAALVEGLDHVSLAAGQIEFLCLPARRQLARPRAAAGESARDALHDSDGCALRLYSRLHGLDRGADEIGLGELLHCALIVPGRRLLLALHHRRPPRSISA